MRSAFLLLAVIAVAFIVVMATGHDGDEPTPPDAGTMPPDFVAALGSLTTPFTPKLDLHRPRIDLPAPPIDVPPSSERTRIATFVLQSGTLAQIRYCPAGQDCTNNLPACLVPERTKPPGGCAPVKRPGPRASLAAGSAGGRIELLAPAGPATLRVE